MVEQHPHLDGDGKLLMLTVLRSARDREEGLTLTELMVVTAVMGLVLAATYGVISAFYTNVHNQELKTTAQREATHAVTGMVVSLRQAVDLSDIGQPVLELRSITAGDSTDRLVFQTDRNLDKPGPEQHTYELRNCVANRCELWEDVRWTQAPHTEPYSYPSAADVSAILLRNVVTDGTPVFTGARWVSGTKTFTDSCDGSPGNTCQFPLVEIVLRVDPDVTRDVPRIVEIREEVRIRNART